MSHIKVEKTGGVSITLPNDLAAVLRVEEGGYVDAEQVEGGILLKPLSAERRRAAALESIHVLQARVRPAKAMESLSPEEQEDFIAETLDDRV
ncbi:MAG: hypothetical protein SGJ21_08010 [Alphaproteobacteria bacterium]|nr:hypothetical protein [Alphaproteobacteria bacterium]